MSISAVQDLFGHAVAGYHPILEALTTEITGVQYTFMPVEDYRLLLDSNTQEAMRIYWEEMLSRAHWAASCAILRHKCWHDACLHLFEPSPNYLGFASALRGLLEASADSFYSLGAAPMTLARDQQAILNALRGASSSQYLTSKDLEDRLIHFHYARRLDRDEDCPDSHKQEVARAYIQSIDGCDNGPIKKLYAELCQLAHPSAYSVLWLGDKIGDSVTIHKPEDRLQILDMTSRNVSAIADLYMCCVNASILVFKTLNYFPLKQLTVAYVDRLNMDHVPGWRKTMTALLGA